MAIDGFTNSSNRTDPATAGFVVTPSDTVNFDYITRYLWVGTGGTFTVVWADDSTTEFANVPNGSLLPIRIKRVNATGLVTADDIVGLY